MSDEHPADPSQAHLPLEDRIFEVGGVQEKIGRVPWWLWVIWAVIFLVAVMNWRAWPGTAFPKEQPAAPGGHGQAPVASHWALMVDDGAAWRAEGRDG